MPAGSNVRPAGLDHATLASSATAAPPANALPVPLPLWIASWKPAAAAYPETVAIAASTASDMSFFDVFISPSCSRPWQSQTAWYGVTYWYHRPFFGARLGCYDILLLRRCNTRAPLFVDRNVGERGFGDLHAFFLDRVALRVDLDVYG